jgi:hypothetical protein
MAYTNTCRPVHQFLKAESSEAPRKQRLQSKSSVRKAPGNCLFVCKELIDQRKNKRNKRTGTA